MKRCYFQGCQEPAVTKEHIPPKAFFPEGKRTNLLTVGSCTAHNNQKSGDDLYVLAHICMNASPANESRDIFRDTVLPQLGYNEDKLGKMIVKDAVRLPGGPTAYRVDIARFERFFSALACGIVYKAAKQSLPAHLPALLLSKYIHFLVRVLLSNQIFSLRARRARACLSRAPCGALPVRRRSARHRRAGRGCPAGASCRRP